MNLSDYGIAVGNPADLVVLDAANATDALASIAEPVMGFKAGRQSFSRPAARLHGPAADGGLKTDLAVIASEAKQSRRA
jgi:cytosine deaminase